MRYVIALMMMLMWGGVQYVSAQDNEYTPEQGETDMDDSNGTYTKGEEPYTEVPATEPAVEEEAMVLEEEEEHSTLGKLWRAPFKFIGNIPKAAFTIGSEVVEGSAHIVGAPFKGVGKLFGGGDGHKAGKDIEEDSEGFVEINDAGDLDDVDVDINEENIDVDMDDDDM